MSLLITSLASVVGLLLGFLLFLRPKTHQRGSSPEDDGKTIPVAGPNLPIIGAGLSFRKQPLGFVLNCIQKHGRVFRVKLGGMRQVVVLGADYTKLFFRAKDDTLSFNDALKAMNFSFFMDDRTFEFPIHIKLLKAKFTPNMKLWTPLMVEVIEPTFIDTLLKKLGTTHWKGHSKGMMIMDIEKLIALIIARSSTRCICGSESYENEELIRTFINFDQDATNLIGMSSIVPRFLHRFIGGEVKNHYDVMMKHLLPIIKKRKESGEKKEDFLGYLLEAKDENGVPLEDEWIVTRLGIMIWASLTTTAGSLAQTILDIFSRPEIKHKVLEEQRRILGDSQTIEHHHIEQMEYLQACAKESLRFTSFLLGPNRLAKKDIKMGDYSIPEGTVVSLSAYVSHHDPELWGSNVDEFVPERFLPEDTVKTKYAYIPFGAGMHACPGRFFALHEIKTIISILARSYDIDIPSGRPKHLYMVNRVTSEQQPIIFTKLNAQ